MRWLLFLLAWLGCCPPCNAAELFAENEIIEVRLKGPLNSVLKDTQQRSEQPFLLGVDGVDIPVMVRVRGKSRARVCEFPPLRLSFSGSQLRHTVFDGQRELKLVTHCREYGGLGDNVLEEYAAYRIFNLLSDFSYRVRLLRISYEDTGPKADSHVMPQYGFVIEPGNQVAARTGGEWAKVSGVKMSWIEEDQAALVFAFQYLVGNTDWSLVVAEGEQECCHNSGLLMFESRYYLVPYDFDLSGLVNAKYARPDTSLRINNVRQRLYRGYCIDSEAVARAIHTVKSKRPEILGVMQELPGYTGKPALRSTEYLEQFFELAENENKLLKSFEKKCLR